MIIISNQSKVDNFSKEKLCVITDFDKTITKFDSESSIGVFSCFFPKQYVETKKKIMEEEENIMSNSSLSEIDKSKLLHLIWIQKLKLLRDYLNDYQVIDDILTSNKFTFREDAIETINYLQKKYQVIINSSGFGNLILKLLKKEGCQFDNLVVFSNFIKQNVFDHSEIIEPSRKYNAPYLDFIKNYQNFVLIGDSLSDLSMLHEKTKCCSIGFLDGEYSDYYDDFLASYDIVATENESYSGPIKKLNL